MYPRLTKAISVSLLLALLISVLPACTPATPTPEATEPEVEEATEAPEAAEPEVEEATEAPEAAEPEIEPGLLEVGVLYEEGSPTYELVKAIGDSMEEDFPGTEVIYTFNNEQARPSVEMRLEAGDPLDIDTFVFNGMQSQTYHWVENGFVLDITDAMNEVREDGTTWKDDFLPLFRPAMEYEGRIYGAPEQVFIMLLHYNKEMFDEWGLTPPTTWDELLQTCEKIKEIGGGVAPIAVAGQSNCYVGIWSDLLLQRIAGADKVLEYMYGDTDMKAANDPDFLLAAQEMNKLSENGYLIEGWEGTDFTPAQLYFFQGKAAMMAMGSWLMTEMKDSIPEGFELAVAPYPSYEGGKGDQNAMFGMTALWTVQAESDVPELAIEFLRRYTSDEIQLQRVEQLGSITASKNVPAPSAIIGAEKALGDAANAEFIYFFYGSDEAQYGMRNAWYDPVVDMWRGELTPEEMLAKLDANIEAIRAQREAAGE